LKRLILIALSSLLLLSNITVVNAATPKIDAASYVLTDISTGRILESKEPDTKRYPASTTKIMTAILALEYGDLDQEMTASEEAIRDLGFDGSNAGIEVGQKMKMEKLLEALLVASANEAANILAENLAPTREDFIELMNQKAVELGAANTHFANTNGLYDSKHYTTASDMAKIACYAMKNADFKKIVCMKSVEMPANVHNKKKYILYSTNNLLYYSSDYFTICGIKTGYLSQSGHNLVSSAYNEDGMQLVSVIFGSTEGVNGRTDFTNSYNLLKYGFTNYSFKTVVYSGSVITSIPVIDSSSGNDLNLVASAPLICAMPKDEATWHIIKDISVNSNIKAPVKKGDVLGTVTISSNGILVKKLDLIAQNAVEKSFLANVRDFFGGIFKSGIFMNILIFIIVAALAIIILRFTLKRISRYKACP